MSKVDKVVPKEKWVFDKDVADCFENMLERSIPQYQVMRDSVLSCLKYFFEIRDISKSGYSILDIGCSDGLMIEHLINNLDGTGYYTGIDVSEPMLDNARERLEYYINRHVVDLQNIDLRYNFPKSLYSAITSILSIQFIPIEHRHKILSNVYKNLVSGGCFIMVEKVLGNTTDINDIMVKSYYNKKAENGYTKQDIERKRLSLEGVLVPITSDWNIELLKNTGFKQVDVFWRWMNFVGYIAIK